VFWCLSTDGREPSNALPQTLEFSCETCGARLSSRRRLAGHRAGKHSRRAGLRNATIRLEGLSDANAAYTAAFLDGEGGIQITRSTRKNREYSLALHPAVYFTNTNQEVIRTIRGWLCCGCVARRRQLRPHKDMHVLTISGTRNVESLLKRLLPYLIVKRARAEIMIDYCESRLTHYRSEDRRYSDLELQLYTQLLVSNKKGA